LGVDRLTVIEVRQFKTGVQTVNVKITPHSNKLLSPLEVIFALMQLALALLSLSLRAPYLYM
jgi:hypothetical protein